MDSNSVTVNAVLILLLYSVAVFIVTKLETRKNR